MPTYPSGSPEGFVVGPVFECIADDAHKCYGAVLIRFPEPWGQAEPRPEGVVQLWGGVITLRGERRKVFGYGRPDRLPVAWNIIPKDNLTDELDPLILAGGWVSVNLEGLLP